MANSTRKSRKRKQTHQDAKPYPEFPLTVHPSGRWAKKHKGTRYYFGKVDDGWETAFAKYENDWPNILEHGCHPTADPQLTPGDGCTFGQLCNEFLNSKRRAMEAGELTARSFEDYHQTTDKLIAHFGTNRRVDELMPTDFEKFRTKLAAKYGTVSLKNNINRARVVFKYAADNRLIPAPVNFGQAFNRPSAKAMRRAKNDAGPKLFEAEEVRRILTEIKDDPVMTAMILLAANCAFGNTDIANLPISAIDFETGWVEFPRVKTEIPRRIPLWPETVESLQSAIEVRPKPAKPENAKLCFLTRTGKRWARVKESNSKPGRMVQIEPLSQRFSRLLKRLKINGRRGLGFYTLRHNFQTIGGDAKDPDAVSAIMGHVDNSMGVVYRERIADDRLQAVVQVVHDWLWPGDDDSAGE